MEDTNKHRTELQSAFEDAMINAGHYVGGKECLDAFDAASRNAGWYAEYKSVLYRHRGLSVTRPLEEWRQFWHEMADGTPFKYWTCMNLDRASYDATLFALTEEDAQIMAHSMELEEPLTDEQMDRVKKMVAAGLEGWQEIMETAIREAVKGA